MTPIDSIYTMYATEIYCDQNEPAIWRVYPVIDMANS